MRAALAKQPNTAIQVRKGRSGDLGAILELENRVFTTDRLSRRSLRHFLRAPTAEILVAEEESGALAGAAVILFRPGSLMARLYSIAVAPEHGGRGVGALLLEATEAAAIARDRHSMRLEVHENNAAAIARYRKSGYRQFGRRKGYYADGGDALRFAKRILPTAAMLRGAPPYVPQTTEFTCGPACMMMALAWADPEQRFGPMVELDLWREATTIFMGSGPGGCGPQGMAVALKRRGMAPEVHASRAGPYFLDSARSEENRRVMRMAQKQFRQQAEALGIATHLTPVSESVLMRSFDAGHVAIVLVSGYHMVPRGRPHWVFAFGRDGHRVLVHDPSAIKDEQGMTPATYAVPWSAFERMMRLGRDAFSVAIVIRKGS